MIIKLKNFEIANILQVLGEIAQQDISEIKLSYRISKIARAFESHNKDIEEARNKYLEKYAKKDKNGEYVRPSNPDGSKNEESVVLSDPEAFQKELLSFMQEEVDVEVPMRLTLDELSRSNIKLAPALAGSLEPILDVEEG